MSMDEMENPILMVAYEYVPCQSAGVQRTLKFTEYLPNLGWKPIILTVKEYAYDRVDEKLSYPPNVEVIRAHGVNAARHLSFKGKYFGFTSIPDRYSTWLPHALYKGRKIIKQQQPKILWSTFPFFSSHWVASKLKKSSGLPWVADFRDPAGFHYYEGSYSNLAREVDELTVRNADRLVFATDAMRNLYCEKYAFLDKSKTRVIENGFNQEAIQGISRGLDGSNQAKTGRSVILHSGAIYPNGRDPRPLIQALGMLKREHPQLASKILVRFRSAECLPEYSQEINTSNCADMVEFAPSVAYEDSLKEMMTADALLLLQGSLFNYQIPGKAYEYLATNKPILCLASGKGATANLYKGIDGVSSADDSNAEQILQCLVKLVNYLQSAPKIERDLDVHSRETKSNELASVLAELTT